LTTKLYSCFFEELVSKLEILSRVKSEPEMLERSQLESNILPLTPQPWLVPISKIF